MGKLFGPGARVVSVIAQIVIMLSITALQYVAGGSILTVILPKVFPTLTHGMLMSAVIFVLITLIGGYWASGLSNLISVAVIYIGIIAALIGAISLFGGWGEISAALPPVVPAPTHAGWMDFVGGIGLATVIGYVTVMVTQAVGVQATIQIGFASKSAKTAKLGMTIGGILILPAGFLCSMFGIMAAAKFPGIKASLALPTVVNQLNPALAGLFLAALWAADISTAVGLLMGCSTLMLQDVVKKIVKVDPKHEMVLSRAGVLFTALLAFILSLTVVGILRTITTALAICSVYAIFLFCNFYCPKVLKKAHGFPMILVALLLWVVWSYFPGMAPVKAAFKNQLVYLEYLVMIVMLIVIALFAKKPANILKETEKD
jgi:SSS family solute:Na+ symporter